MIWLYEDFILEEYIKLDAPLYFTKECRDFIQALANDGDPVAQELVNNINTPDKVSDITWVDLTDKSDMISFVQVNRILRYRDEEVGDPQSKEQGTGQYQTPQEYLKYIKTWGVNAMMGNRYHDLYKDKTKRTELNVGRFANKILNKFGFNVSPVAINKFVDNFKSKFEMDNNLLDLIEIVEGEEVRYWYLEDNYYKPQSQLYNSCMKKDYCQDYLDIYVENSEIVKLAILKSQWDDTKIIGRALIWKLDNGKTFLDRPYANEDKLILAFKKWAKKKGWEVYGGYEHRNVKLKKWKFELYPYMDTFKYLNTKTGFITSDGSEWDDGNSNWGKLESTLGEIESALEMVYSEYYGEDIVRDEAVWAVDVQSWIYRDGGHYLKYKNEWVSNDCATVKYSPHEGSHFYEEDLVYSDYMQNYLYDKNAIEGYIDSNTIDYLPTSYLNTGKVKQIEMDGQEFYCLTSAIIKNPFADEWFFKDGDVIVFADKRGGQYISQREGEQMGYDLGSKLDEVSVETYLQSKIDDETATFGNFFEMVLEYDDKSAIGRAERMIQKTSKGSSDFFVKEWEKLNEDERMGLLKLCLFFGFRKKEKKRIDRSDMLEKYNNLAQKLAPENLIKKFIRDDSWKFKFWEGKINDAVETIFDSGREKDRKLIIINYLFKNSN